MACRHYDGYDPESMMYKSREAVSVRVDVETKKYVELFARKRNLSLTEALASIVREREYAEPMTFKMCRCISDFIGINETNEDVSKREDGYGYENYDVSVDGAPDAFCAGPTKEAALVALANFRKENGYCAHRFKLQKEVEVVDIRVDYEGADPDEARDLKEWLRQQREERVAQMKPRDHENAAQ
jgi:hypothetical protein